ncbi:MAG: hypothetical protein ABTQ26_19110 [Azonexus sp.]
MYEMLPIFLCAFLLSQEALGANYVDDLLRQIKQPITQPTRVSPPASSRQRSPESVLEEPGGLYSGPPRWSAGHLFESKLINDAKLDTGRNFGNPKDGLALYVLSEQRKKTRIFSDIGTGKKLNADLNQCVYEKKGTDKERTISILFWPVDGRMHLSPRMASINSDGLSDLALDNCPDDLASGLEAGFGAALFDRLASLIKSRYSEKTYCEAEIAADESKSDISQQERSNLFWYKTFNQSDNDRDNISRSIATAHFVKGDSGKALLPDKTLAGVCILKVIADTSRYKDIGRYAKEGYALRLLTGDGVKQDRAQAIKYLEDAARNQSYGAASMRLARIYTEDASDPNGIKKAIPWLHHAVDNIESTPGGSPTPPGDAIPKLFDIYLSGKFGPKDYGAAEKLYRQVMNMQGFDFKSVLASALPKIPGLKEKLEVERQVREATERAALQPNRRTCQRSTRVFGNQISSVESCY